MTYSDHRENKSNINNFSEGLTDNIRDKRLMYQYNSMSPRGNEHGYKLSLACQSGTDMAHTTGNVTALVLQFIVDQFPPNTFATAIPSTKLASKQLRHTPSQIRTQPYPMCIVTPRRASVSGLDNRLAAGSFATSTYQTTSCRFQNRSEMPILFFDKQKGIEWRGKINRVVQFFDFVLSFQSAIEQENWGSYLVNRLPTDGGRFFDIDTALEMAIPDGFLEETAKYAGIPVKDENGNVSKFMDYLNMNSVFPTTYRFSSGRHKDAFYQFYMTSILCSIDNYSNNTVTKVNQTESDCPITFTLRCEYNTIGMFDLSVPNPGPYRLIKPLANSIAIPIFSDFVNDKDFPLLYGWKIHSKPICKLDWGETEVYIGGLFGNEIQELIDYHLKHNIPVDLFISIKLRENRCLIEDGYYVDWKRRMLIFTNVSYTHTYRMIVSVNKLYIQKFLTEAYGK